MNSTISVLVVTHNHSEYIHKLINSLVRFKITNVFFCDACSSDGTLEILQKSPYKANVLAKKKLEGFSKNNNDLIRHFNIDTKYYLLLNPDTFFDSDFISILYNKMELDASIGIITPVLKYPDGRLQITWKKFPGFFTVLKKRLGLLKAINEKTMAGPDIDWCLGACMLISNVLMKNNNMLLDERYRLYCEDIDICFEAHDKGLKVIGDSDTSVFHHLNETSAKNIFSKYNLWNISSIFKFLIKWNINYVKKV
ncbi:glycosyltransferase family 2 protein [Flavivirga amylovorans]|uniref:Glycosyltransferase family 2 protein n=1 Tax=Flavivirga amylovorans TaxID=870486 RepID=A0ABT8X5V8_9FLAO|nr:glycosyltransferase family 2 protein [Flavivirga amylovorans]MDO5989279.1 glycosyltransferase family 2 protein [Flavivirga amylovorans]